MSDGAAVRTTVNGGVLEVVLDRPKANAIDAATSRELGQVFAGFRDDPSLRVAVFTGAGDRFFSAGWDLGAAADGEEFEADYGEGGFGGFGELPRRNKPVVCAVNGLAVGGGFEIALAAEFVVAAEHAEFFLPEAGLGIIPDTGAVRLPRILPPAVATEVLIGGRRLDAREAERWGLVNRVVPVADLRAAVDHATTGLDRVDELLDTAESISTTVDAASRLTYRAFSPPLIGAAAVSAGIGRFVRRLRGGPLAAGPGDAVVEAGAVELRRGRRRGGAA